MLRVYLRFGSIYRRSFIKIEDQGHHGTCTIHRYVRDTFSIVATNIDVRSGIFSIFHLSSSLMHSYYPIGEVKVKVDLPSQARLPRSVRFGV